MRSCNTSWSDAWYLQLHSFVALYIFVIPFNFASCHTVDTRWLELRTLEVLDLEKWNHGLDVFLYITYQIYFDLSKFLISRSKILVLLYIISLFFTLDSSRSMLCTRAADQAYNHDSSSWVLPGWSSELLGASVNCLIT